MINHYMSKFNRYIPESTRKQILGDQKFRCANSPDSNIRFINNFNCPRWQIKGFDKGLFIQSNYELDHIIEVSLGGSNDISNLHFYVQIVTRKKLNDVER